MFTFYLLFFVLHTAYGALLYADPGQQVTLPCVFTSGAKYLSWYKQAAGEKPQIMSSFYKHSRDAIGFFNQFKDKNRFSAQTGEGFYHLIISNVQESDSAMYYCGQTSITTIEFHEGIFLVLKDSSASSFIRQPASDPAKQGDAVTLSCTVHTGTCDGEHSVYWFKNSEESNPGLIYANGGQNDKCESKPISQSLTCVYNLPMTSLNLSHAGTYYCAVVACGRILFVQRRQAANYNVLHEKEKQLPIIRVSSNNFRSIHDKRRGLPKQTQPLLCHFKCRPDRQIKTPEGSNLE
ncbi:uncharacterized protein LOC132958648 [Labrus mixtus]|uniref:uncharacterized protein LOC132958648 n=1 Tax=Labrus mixtus TaxID=508554 RepID=UPI0029C000B9|nr:uncharacterized protein LOC132958648 [Labrus mixtus]